VKEEGRGKEKHDKTEIVENISWLGLKVEVNGNQDDTDHSPC